MANVALRSDEVPRVVFDCMVYLQAVANEKGPAAAALRLLDDEAIELYVSRQILAEVQDVLSRPKVRQRNPLITDKSLSALLQRLEDKAVLMHKVPAAFRYSRDPKDEPYLNLAIAAEAQYLVSRDNDLLDLMSGHTDECKEFRQRFRFLKIVDPLTFLANVGA